MDKNLSINNFKELHEKIESVNIISSAAAEENYDSDKHISKCGTALKLFTEFFKQYFFKGLIKKGLPGFIESMLYSSRFFLTNLKTLKLQKRI